MKWHPLRFRPIYKERVWGGRRIAELYSREAPRGGPIGESWEISDRPDDVSVVAEGYLAGRTLRELMLEDSEGLLGAARTSGGRFPLLVKILDARDVLSLQVHPPAAHAAKSGGEPKTEMWYFTEADPGAEILAGLRRGVTRADFEMRRGRADLADCFYRIRVGAGDAMFLPSGRVHALGAGLVLFEIQENSDTTYRVYDWDRAGLDGKPRALHWEESMASIDFSDCEPGLVGTGWRTEGGCEVRTLAESLVFRAEVRRAGAGTETTGTAGRCQVVGVVKGRVVVEYGAGPGVGLGPGDFCLLPAALNLVRIRCAAAAEWIVAEPVAA